MLLAGDEIGRSQKGNNNAYCQDNEINWLNWQGDDIYAEELTPFLASLSELRTRFPMLAYHRFIHKDDKQSSVDFTWYHRSGLPMQKEHWHAHHASTLGCLINEKQPLTPKLLCLFHAGNEPIEYQLPNIDGVSRWEVMVDTSSSAIQSEKRYVPADRMITMVPFSTIVLLDNASQGESVQQFTEGSLTQLSDNEEL